MPEKDRGRKDHILPRGYLDGFTNPKGFLQVFHIKEGRWFPGATADVAWERGFYDYSENITPDQTADDAFKEYEGKFPELRRDLIVSNFANWRLHLDFLIRYINMFRVRSKLYREHVLQGFEDQPPMVIDKITENAPHPKIPGKFATKIKLKPMAQTGEALKTSYADLSISKMRADMLEVPKPFFTFDWCLRTTNNPNKPVITADDAIRLEGVSIDRPFEHFQSRIYFPLCWQACLVGGPDTLLPNTKPYSPSRLSELRGKYLRSDCRFAYSPVIVSDIPA
jgi:Protein of unknown function (DUF4238)